jgi:peptide deformylase
LKADELLAQALEHEIDHLDGILYVDHLESPDKLTKVEPVETQA